MIIRKYETKDCPALAELFYDTVHSVNAKDYSEEQRNAWATGEIDFDKWNTSFLSHFTVVAVENNTIVGFGDIDRDGYLDRLYVHKDYQRKGIASAICNCLEKACPSDKITTHASITAKPFFLNRGFDVLKEQQVIRNGIALTNYAMEKAGNRHKSQLREVSPF